MTGSKLLRMQKRAAQLGVLIVGTRVYNDEITVRNSVCGIIIMCNRRRQEVLQRLLLTLKSQTALVGHTAPHNSNREPKKLLYSLFFI